MARYREEGRGRHGLGAKGTGRQGEDQDEAGKLGFVAFSTPAFTFWSPPHTSPYFSSPESSQTANL